MTRAELIQFINANIYPNGRNQITAPMVRDSILAVVGFLGDAAVKDIGAVLENNTDLVTGGAVYDAIRAYLSSVMKMVGETTTDVITNPTANPVYVDGVPHTAQKGDVVVYGYKEFWWTGSIWKELGDEASWALKTISITGTGDLTGGGTLEANRTLDLTQSAKDKLAHGETAFSWLESYSTNRLRLKSPYSYLNARKGLILEEETDYTNTPADFVKQVITIGETEYTILRSKLPIVSDSFISAGGISPGGGASGTTLQAVWDSLTTNTGDYANAKIHSGHIPLGSGLGVDGSGNIYVTSQGTVTGIKIGSTTYTPSAGSTIVDISSGIPTSMAWSAITSTPTTLAGYGITDAKIESGVITLGSSTITPLTSHQTIYNLVINNSAGTAQITYKPNVSGTYSLTLTSAMVGLGNVENTALSTWAGTSNITTLGTISTGVWQGTAIGYNYVAAHYIGRTRTTASAAQATLLGIDAISNASSSGSSDASRIVWDSTNNAWHFLGGIYADSFISAGGLSSGGGTSGIDLAAMWASLQNNDIGTSGPAYEHRNDKIHTWHLPACGTGLSYTTDSGGLATGINVSFPVTSVAGYTGAVTSANIATALTSAGYKLTDTTYSAGTGLSLSGTTFNHSNSVTAQTTQGLYPIKIDAQGHISAYGSEVTSLPASDVYSWAKQASKPSYSFSEITGTASTAQIPDLSGNYVTLNTDQTINSTKTFVGNVYIKNAATRISILPWENETYIESMTADGSANAPLWITGKSGSEGSSLYLDFANIYATSGQYPVLHSGNYSSYALPLTGGTISSDTFGALVINRGSSEGNSIGIKFTGGGVNAGYIGVHLSAGSYRPGYWDASTNFSYFYHSANANLYTVDWTCNNSKIFDALLLYADLSAITHDWYRCSISAVAEQQSPNYLNPAIVFKTMHESHEGGTETEKMRLSSAGNLNIGYAGDAGYKLYVYGNAVATGSVTAGSASDQRLKENIESMNGADAKSLIMALRPVTYRWNALATSLYDKYVGEDVGFVAQEVQPYMPVAISTIFEKYMRLDQTKFIAPLVSVAQDHETRIRELERENKELKEEIKRLRS